jgi:hypothetical protein
MASNIVSGNIVFKYILLGLSSLLLIPTAVEAQKTVKNLSLTQASASLRTSQKTPFPLRKQGLPLEA